jgi:hypothetical protein
MKLISKNQKCNPLNSLNKMFLFFSAESEIEKVQIVLHKKTGKGQNVENYFIESQKKNIKSPK